MKIDVEFHAVELPVELMQICGAYAACIYAVLRDEASDGHVTISQNEISKKTGIPTRSIPRIMNKLLSLGIVDKHQADGSTPEYIITDILQNKTDPTPENLPERSAQELPELSKYAVPKQKRKRMPYYVMLDAIGSPLASEFVTCEDDIKGITDDRMIEKCKIPENWAFTDDTVMVEDALKYLSYYSEITSDEKKEFAEEVLLCLTESICTGMKGNVHGVDPVHVIRRINELIHGKYYTFGQWIWDFARKYSDHIDAHAENIYNKHNYLKTSAINFLTEHKSGVTPGFMDYEELSDYGGVE